MNHAPTPGREVLLTGVTGFLGKVVLESLLRRREELGIGRIHVLVRPRPGQSAGARFREVARSPCFAGRPAGWERRVEVVEGDLERSDAGIDPEASRRLWPRVSHVLHAAASVDFDLPLEEATRINAMGSLHLLEWARRCERLERLLAVSTAYVTPHPGAGRPVEEVPAPLPRPAEAILAEIQRGEADEELLLAEAGHPNTYTFTKCLGEHLLAGRRGAVPLTILRPSIISASWRHPFPGWIDSQAAFAAFVALVGLGHLRAVVADPDSRLDLVPVDAVAERVLVAAGLTEPRPAGPEVEIWHAVAGDGPSIRECRERILAFFRAHPVGRRPAVPYLGPAGRRYALARALHHRLPVALAGLRSRRLRERGRRLLERLDHVNRAFPYFTHSTFAFRTRAPLDAADFQPPRYVDRVCQGVHAHLLGGDEQEVPLAGRRGPDLGGDLRFALAGPRGTGPMLKLAAYAVTKALRRSSERVSFDARSFRDALAGAAPRSRIVLVPSHRSYLDFVLCSYLCFARPDLGIAVPHVAAALEFARIPVLGGLFRSLRAFYLRRGVGREDKELTRQVHELIRRGETLEFFIEGGRSRSRELLPARRGLLRSLQATGERLSLLPVSFSFDRVPEEAAFLEELSGADKAPMRLRDLLRWAGRMARGRVALGRVHVACGRPVPLDLESDVHQVGEAVRRELQRATAVSEFHLRAYASLHAEPEWAQRVLTDALHERGVPVLESALRAPLDPRLALGLRHHFAHHLHPAADSDAAGHPVLGAELARHAHGGGAAGAPDADAAALRILFEPVRRAWLASVEALGLPPAPLALADPRAVARALPVPVADAEAVFAELERRGVLRRTRNATEFGWGPRAAEIEAFAAACRRPVAEGP